MSAVYNGEVATNQLLISYCLKLNLLFALCRGVLKNLFPSFIGINPPTVLISMLFSGSTVCVLIGTSRYWLCNLT